ncbi:MAG: PH domain-containing protein [Dehalococcoidales bacterium]|nr:PH domain-containing protein [Dehalococcoidales bacterium]
MARYAEDLIVDKKDQLEKIEGICLPDEIIRAVFDLKGRGTGFLGLTDKRIIFYDKEFMKKRKAIVSIPYRQIASVASEDNKGFFIKSGFLVSDTLIIEPIGVEPRIFEFRGGDKAHAAHSIIMQYLLE